MSGTAALPRTHSMETHARRSSRPPRPRDWECAGSVVEPLIALSIAYVAIENIVRAYPNSGACGLRFGLLHGLGFAGALTIDPGLDWRMISSLFAFNFGIELGQALVIGLVWPLLRLARRFHRPQQLAHTTVSGLIAAVGLLWVFDRLPFP